MEIFSGRQATKASLALPLPDKNLQNASSMQLLPQKNLEIMKISGLDVRKGLWTIYNIASARAV